MIRGKCGSREQLMSYIEQNYKRRYVATYNLEEKWINIALETYHYGIFNNVGITQASRVICEKYKCSHTRLANFIRELKLWELEPIGQWILPICEKTITFSYITRKGIIEIWELTIDIPHPFSIEVKPKKCEESTTEEMLEIIGDELGIPWALIEEMKTKCERLEEESTDQTKLLNEIYRKETDEILIEVDLLWQREKQIPTPYAREWSYVLSFYISKYKVWKI